MKNNESLTISEKLIPSGARVLCALSGGADSVCLLHLLKDRKDITLAAAHLNHGIRGEEADRDEGFVKSLCSSLQIPVYTEKADIPMLAENEGKGLEETARQYRYEFLFRVAERWGADCIATAHNRNDDAETVLLNLARGTGLRGLGGIPASRGKIVRPLLDYSRDEIEAYLKNNNCSWVEDSTNSQLEYSRNRVRWKVLPELEKVHSGAAENIHRMTALLREDEELMTELAEEFLQSQPEDELSVSELLSIPAPVARRAVRLWLNTDLSAEHTEAVLFLCRGKPTSELHLPGGVVFRSYNTISKVRPQIKSLPIRELVFGERLYLPETGQTVLCEMKKMQSDDEKETDSFIFSYKKICGKLYITSRFEGDKIKFRGRTGTRSIRKLMIDNKIPQWKRSIIPVIRDEAGVVAVYGFGVSERVTPEENEQVYKITFLEVSEGEQF